MDEVLGGFMPKAVRRVYKLKIRAGFVKENPSTVDTAVYLSKDHLSS